jgi:hypothetical protein
MTPQQVFDTVVNHLRQQGGRSLLTDKQCKELHEFITVCAYRGKNGFKCSAGALIYDEEYLPEMEGKNFAAVLNNYFGSFVAATSLKERLLPHIELIIYLQQLHDNVAVEEWEVALQRAAEQFSLIYTPPLQPKQE